MTHKKRVVSVQDTYTQITRETILNADIDIVNEGGMNQLTVRNVCEKSGLSTGSFYNLFSGKDELIMLYLKHIFGTYKQKALSESSHFNAIEKCLLVYRNYIECCKELGVDFISTLYAANNALFFDFINRDPEDELVLDAIREFFNEGKQTGVIREDVDIDEALLRIAALVTGFLFYWCVFKGNIDVAYETDETLKTLLLSYATNPEIEISLPALKRPNKLLYNATKETNQL